MTFVTLLTVEPAKNRETYEALSALSVPEEIDLKLKYGLFGGRDAILIYEAPDEEIAMDFLLDVCKLPGIVDTETCIAKGL